MPKLTEIVDALQKSGKLYDGYMLSPEERAEIEERFKNNTLSRISKKEKISRFSVIKDEKGNLFSVYNPSVLDPSKDKSTFPKGHHGVVKVAQNLKTGEFVALKIQKETLGYEEGTARYKMAKAEGEQVETEKKYLEKRGALKGYQSRIKDQTKKHYVFQKIVPGYMFASPQPGYAGYDPNAKTFVNLYFDKMDEKDFLQFYHKLLTELQVLKDEGMIHRDLHGGNILVDVSPDNQYELTIIDWGSAVDADESGKWVGFHHADWGQQMGKITYTNGQDVFDIMSEVKFWTQSNPKANFTALFGNEWDESSLLAKSKSPYSDDSKVIDLKPYIAKVEEKLAKQTPKPGK